MATATDFSATIGSVGMVSFGAGLGGGAPLVVVDMAEMVAFSKPTDLGVGTANPLTDYVAEQASFTPPTDTLGATVNDIAGGASQESRDPVPLVYKMRGWSTTLGQYVFWRSVGDPFVPAPSEYGTVVNVTSELIQ